ncbi:MAG TPA: hypothetical protein VKR30_07030 [Candidatus Limnocylindrales bacterium]|nr:hypothetical protein [Candidatus Limnocylindrales bacterium]
MPANLGVLASIVGLILVAIVSVDLVNGRLPFVGGNNGGGPAGSGGPGGAIKTPTASNVVVVDPRQNVPGSILYVKDGNIWVQTGGKATQLTGGGLDSQPTWSPDGRFIYFVRDTPEFGHFPLGGVVRGYDLQIPTLERMAPDGSGIHAILTGRYAYSSYVWSFFIQQPSISPDGRTAAIITDGPNPNLSDIRLKFVDLRTGAITDPHLADIGGLGQQDPSFSPDGSSVAYVRNARVGPKGAAVVVRYALATKAVRQMTGPGYIQPAWSPDSRFLAVTAPSTTGTDIVIIDARTGSEVLRLTNDGNSFDPVWSPAGNAIAFQRIEQGVVDLWLVSLVGTGPSWQVGPSIQLTLSAGIDATSRESWFIPPNELPSPAPTAESGGQATPSASPGQT